MADSTEDKDVPMEDVTEVAEELPEKKVSEVKKGKGDEEKKNEDDDSDDGGAASDVEFNAEDDRSGFSEQESWTWHIEVYPLAPEDIQLDNFFKMISVADESQTRFRINKKGEKRGEAHFYTNDAASAKTLIRTICCRKFSNIRPYIYLSYLNGNSELETASLRLDLIEAAKMRWDRQRKNIGEPSTRVAKVSHVPLGTTKEFLSVLFARAFEIKQDTDESEEEAKKAKEAAGNGDSQAKSNSEEENDDEVKQEINEEDEQLVSEFNGNLTIDCISRTSLKGFLLGYRKVLIGGNLLDIKALAAQDFNVEELRKEVRNKRKEEDKQGKVWKPMAASDRPSSKDDDAKGGAKPSNKDARGRGARGARGGRVDFRGGGRGGIMTGRQKMEEKMRRGGGREIRGGGRGAFGLKDDMQYQMAMNTYRLERQMISVRARGRGGIFGPGDTLGHGGDFGPGGPFGPVGSYRDFPPDLYDMPPMCFGGYDDYDARDDWGYFPGPRYGIGIGTGRVPVRGLRGRR